MAQKVGQLLRAVYLVEVQFNAETGEIYRINIIWLLPFFIPMQMVQPSHFFGLLIHSQPRWSNESLVTFWFIDPFAA